MYRNLGSMQWLQEMYASKDGPNNPKRHRKGENIWIKGQIEPDVKPNMREFPSDREMEQAWECGYIESCDVLKTIGVVHGKIHFQRIKEKKNTSWRKCGPTAIQQ